LWRLFYGGVDIELMNFPGLLFTLELKSLVQTDQLLSDVSLMRAQARLAWTPGRAFEQRLLYGELADNRLNLDLVWLSNPAHDLRLVGFYVIFYDSFIYQHPGSEEAASFD
jgi:hypothetical protein